MKLRSGKVKGTLPKKLDDKLEDSLERFKEAFSDNPEHAKKLLNIIGSSKGIESRAYISRTINEAYNDNELPVGTSPLLSTAGDLMLLVIGKNTFYKKNHIEPIYHDIIQSRIENFDLETPLLGDMEE